jgi:hypothetical protein
MRETVLLIFLLLAWSGSLITQTRSANVLQLEESVLLDFSDQGGFCIAEGAWSPDNLNKKRELAYDAVVRLECYKTGGQRLVGAEAYCMEATARVLAMGDPFPEISVHYYPVKHWGNDMIIAAGSPTDRYPVCIWTQIAISLRERSVMSIDTRKLAKGHEGLGNACAVLPPTETYHLVNGVAETARRHSSRSARK